ncbi:MAG: hypothetical protein ACP5MK_03920, partial [Candidatus Micrarchaeia archaeon]
KLLLSRLEARNYPKWKISENIVAEGLDYCGEKASSVYKNVYEVESEKEKSSLIKGFAELDKKGKSAMLAPLKKKKDKTNELLSFIKSNKDLNL